MKKININITKNPISDGEEFKGYKRTFEKVSRKEMEEDELTFEEQMLLDELEEEEKISEEELSTKDWRRNKGFRWDDDLLRQEEELIRKLTMEKEDKQK